MSISVDMSSAGPDQAESDGRHPVRLDAARPKRRRNSLLRFWPAIRPYRVPLFGSIALAILVDLTGIAIPIVVARIVDGPIAHRDFGAAVAPTLCVLLLGLADAFGIWGRRWLVARSATSFEVAMRAKIFRKLQALSVGVHDSWESGQLLSRAIGDLSTMRRFVAGFGPFALVNLITVLTGLAVLSVLSWQIGLVQLVVAIPLVIVCFRFVRRYIVATRRSQDQEGDLATVVEESAQGIRVLKAFGRGGHFGTRFTEQARDLQGTELFKARLDATLWSVMQSLPQVAMAFAIAYGAFAVVHGAMSLGTLVATITLATFLQWPIVVFGILLAELNNARTAADRYWEIIDTPVDIRDPEQPVPLPAPLVGELRLDHVRFRFPDSEVDVLQDISLVLRPGETVALVGATGSGKTALLNLIPRLYDVTAGSITIDGIGISAMRLADLRSIVAVAFEDPVLFSAGVRENVALGDPEATEADVRRALAVAHADEFVDKLPWGIDTRIGEQGLSLSGGQRQRLALARAVLSGADNPDRARIVVLDDPLSALDVETEVLVQAQLRSVLAGATTLLVAHRPSTAALADRVAVLADGRIVAEGPHEHLLETSSRYRELMGGAR